MKRGDRMTNTVVVGCCCGWNGCQFTADHHFSRLSIIGSWRSILLGWRISRLPLRDELGASIKSTRYYHIMAYTQDMAPEYTCINARIIDSFAFVQEESLIDTRYDLDKLPYDSKY
eukprot:scaffold116_cov165-Amphora_coffeaeformis.AAC.5